jgi:hypothetical protein
MSSADTATIVASVLGGGVAGTFVSTYVSSTREARAARADLARRILDVEMARWNYVDFQEFRQAAAALEAAAIIAHVPRPVVQQYLYMARVGRRTEQIQMDSPGGIPGGAIPSDLAQLIEMAVETLSAQLWHPRRARLSWKTRVGSLNRVIDRLRSRQPAYGWLTGPADRLLDLNLAGSFVRLGRRFRRSAKSA